MNRQERKEWLLHLWDYHNGLLRPEEVREIEDRLGREVESRIDSQRVRELIEELRQSGRWETHPSFPEEMVERILKTEAGSRGKLIGIVLIVLLILVYLFFFRGQTKKEVGLIPEESSGLSLMTSNHSGENGGEGLDFTPLEQGVEKDIQTASHLQVRPPGIVSATSPEE